MGNITGILQFYELKFTQYNKILPLVRRHTHNIHDLDFIRC